MPNEQALTLKVANGRDVILPLTILALLALVSALLSPQPVVLLITVLLVLVSGWVLRILYLYNVSDVILTSVIFPGGQVKIKFDDKNMIAGSLDGQQWCTRHVAVLRIIDKQGGVQKLLILSMQQQSADVFRRLNMWLRQDFCKDTQDSKVSLS